MWDYRRPCRVMASPRRLRSSARECAADPDNACCDIEAVVDSVICRLTAAGLLAGTGSGAGPGDCSGTGGGDAGGSGGGGAGVDGGAAGGAAGGGDSGESGLGGGGSGGGVVKSEFPESAEPSPSRRRLWLQELREQLPLSRHYGIREREEVRGLLIIGEGAGPPPDLEVWYWNRVRLYLIIAHRGWTAAISDARSNDMDRLGIHLAHPLPAQSTALRAAREAPPPPASWRGRPSRPSGLRPPSGGASRSSAPRRKN